MVLTLLFSCGMVPTGKGSVKSLFVVLTHSWQCDQKLFVKKNCLWQVNTDGSIARLKEQCYQCYWACHMEHTGDLNFSRCVCKACTQSHCAESILDYLGGSNVLIKFLIMERGSQGWKCEIGLQTAPRNWARQGNRVSLIALKRKVGARQRAQ